MLFSRIKYSLDSLPCFFCGWCVSSLILLCQCSLYVPTLLLPPPPSPPAVLLSILPSHCVVYSEGSGGLGGDMRVLGARWWRGKTVWNYQDIFLLVCYFRFYFPFFLFFSFELTTTYFMLSDFVSSRFPAPPLPPPPTHYYC